MQTRPPRSTRRAASSAGVLATAALCGGLAVTAAVVTPRSLRAAPGPKTLEAREEPHRQVLELLGAIVGRSREVLAVHPRGGATPFAEIVLWIEDAERPGEIDAGEVAVMSHSAALQTVTWYALDPGERSEDGGGEGERAGAPEVLAWSDTSAPDFVAAWRRRPDVHRRILASGVAGMEVERQPGERPMLRISLTWAGRSADPPDEAAALVAVAMRRGGGP